MKSAIVAVFVIAFSTQSAFAVSMAVKMACKDDYFAHCSMHAVGSPGVRKCMRAVGPRLSQRCIGALADAGEIKKSRVALKSKKANKQFAVKAVSGKKARQLALKKAGKVKIAKNAGSKKHLAKLNKGGMKKQAIKSSKGKIKIAKASNGKVPALKRVDNGMTAKQRYAARN
jgi:hypothetical protein